MRKIIFCLFVLCLILIIDSAAAVPASPYPFTFEQPDGYSFQARQYGDERVHWIETLDGYTIVRDENEWWTYAAKNNEGKLIPTGNRVGMVTLLSLVFEKHIAPVWKPDNISITKSSPRQINIKVFDSNVYRASKASSVTTEKAVVILINFTDVSQQPGHTKPYYDNLIFNNTTGANSMFNYYREVSYNQLNVTGTSGSNWYQSSHTMAYYGADSTPGGDDYNTYIFNLTREAVQLADNDIDFSQYDTDSDGVVDHVIIIHAGNAQESSGISNDIWSHKGSIWNYYSGSWHEDGELTNDGVRVIQYTMLAEGSPLGTFAHEFGHDIGLPDLYNTSSGNGVVCGWDLMDQGSWNNNGNTPAHPSVWCKTLLGWLTPTVITLPSTQSILQIETNSVNSAYKISSTAMSANEYFLVENRQLTGYDAWLPEAGILIWHIDESQGTISDNDINNYAVKRVIPEDASNGAIAYLGGAAYSSDYGQFAFNAITTPNSNKNDGNPSGIKIYNIGARGSSMWVTFFNTAPTVSVTSPNGDEAISGNMTITWTHADIDPTDTHTFTIKLSSDGGTTYPTTIVSGLDESVSSYVNNTTAIGDGSNYKIQVISTDNYTLPLSGNDSSDSVFTIDNHPPVLIGNPTGYPTGQIATKNGSQITLNVTIIDLGAGVKNATVNASQINASLMIPLILEKVNSYWINQSVIVNAADGIYYLPVTAYDNASNANTSAVIKVTVDNTPPIIIANPTGYPVGFTAAKNGSTITLNASINDALAGVRNATVNISLINSSFGDISLINSSGFWINDVVVNATDGTYLLNITAYDNASNYNDSAQVTVVVDNTPPTAAAIVEYQKNSAANNGSTVTLNVSTNDNLVGVKNVTANVSAVNISGDITLTKQGNNWTGSVVVAATDGNHSVNITVMDNASNINYTEINVTMDNTPPDVNNVMALPNIINISGYTNITAVVSGPDVYNVSVNITYPNGTHSTIYMNNISNVYYRNFSNSADLGRYNVTIIANDTTGNVNDTQKTSFIVAHIDTHTTIITNASNSTIINASGANVTLELFTNDSIMGTINITRSNVNITDEMAVPGAGIYIRINASTNFSNDNYSNLSWAKIKVYYTHEDVSDNNLVESSLRLYWYNESSGTWVKLVTNSPSWVYGSGVDTANNYVWANVSHFSDYAVGGELPEETTPPSNGGGGGGSSGGGTSGEDFYNIILSENDRQSVFKNTSVSFNFDLEGNIVKHINFTALNSAGTVATKIEILNNTSTLVSTPPPHEVFKNLNIWVGNFGWATGKNMAGTTVSFMVERSWVIDNDISESSIALYRYSNDNWGELATRKTGEDSNYLYFEADVPGFSPFAITGKKTMGEPRGEGIIEPTVTAEKTPTPTETKGIPGFSLFAGLSILLIAVQLLRRKN